MTPIVRAAIAADLPAIQSIYAHHVLHGTATFELIPPPWAEMSRRFEQLAVGNHPYLVAEADGRTVGFAYAGPYRERPAYRRTVENAIYLDPTRIGQGIGRQLLSALISEATSRGFTQMVAVIGDSANQPSIRLHTAAGFKLVGTLTHVGYKFERWLDTVIMQRSLQDE